MKPSTRKILKLLLEFDETVTEQQKHNVFSILFNCPEQLTEPPILLTQSQVAILLGVSRWTVRNLTMEGKIRTVSIRGAKRYRREEIDKVAMEGTET